MRVVHVSLALWVYLFTYGIADCADCAGCTCFAGIVRAFVLSMELQVVRVARVAHVSLALWVPSRRLVVLAGSSRECVAL